ncbi:MAG TPA: SAM-dependent chlorinase/fluorinase [Nitrospira sp.]|nr:SAM-dependent chlorinase/fluorinase [Nitrospira sp.]
MPHPASIITLLTDFGDRDWFVASMKGVILSINPQATIVDLSHHVPSHDIQDGAYVWESCYRYFPDGTIHVAVVDPGVGTDRRPLVAKSARYFFCAPDNGLLTHVFEQEGSLEVREIENKQYRLEAEGHTFDGRDVFAPAAAWLTKQQPFASYGRLVADAHRFALTQPHWEETALVGEVVYVDVFGNLITNVSWRHVKEVREITKRPNPLIRIAGQSIDGLVASYAEGEPGSPGALINSDGRLEIYCKEASASKLLKVSRHEPVRLS